MNSKAIFTRCAKVLCAAMTGITLSLILLHRASGADALQDPQTKPAPDENRIRSIADLDGDWAGQRDGLEVKLQINSKAAVFRANWMLIYQVRRDPPAAEQSPTLEVRKGADLKCARDETGRIKLFLPAYHGSDEALKRSPALTGKSPVGILSEAPDGALKLRVIPTGYNNSKTAEYDLPAVQGVLLHRVSTPKH